MLVQWNYWPGVEAERLLFPDQTPSAATYDMQQALAFASLVASTAKSAAAFFDFARCEAAEILAQSGQLPWRRPNVKRWMVSRSTRSSPLR
jgi:hypothetical protein